MKWGAVQFVVDGPEGSPEQVRLPAVDGPDPAQWLREQPPAIPDEIVQELRRHGPLRIARVPGNGRVRGRLPGPDLARVRDLWRHVVESSRQDDD